MSRAEKWAVTGSNPLTAMTRLLPLVSQLRCPGLSDKRGLTEIVAWPLRDTAALAAEDKPGGELAFPRSRTASVPLPTASRRPRVEPEPQLIARKLPLIARTLLATGPRPRPSAPHCSKIRPGLLRTGLE